MMSSLKQLLIGIADKAFPEYTKRRFFAKILYRFIKHPILMIKMINPERIRNYFVVVKKGGMEQVEYYYNRREQMTIREVSPEKSFEIEKINDIEKGILDYEKFEIPFCSAPVVSIIIPVYNEFNYTYNCIKAIYRNSGDVSYEIIVANDCSTDITTSIEQIIRNVRLINNKVNLRFLLNCNNAARHAKGKYILFLNNDTQVQKNWLKPLVDLIESDEKIGMVGSKLVYPDGRLQEAGGIIWNDGSAWNYGHLANADDPEYNYVKETDYISGAAIMIKSGLWNEIGGFDERYIPAYCEDSDLAFEVRKHGYKVMYQPLSVVVHFEGVSNGTDTTSGLKAYQVVNSKKFYEKWKQELEEHYSNAENLFIARDRSYNKPVLLMIDHYVPHYDKDAGSRTVFQYLKLFTEKGFNVKFLGDNFYRHEPYTTALQQLGVEVLYGQRYAKEWKKWIKQNSSHIRYVFLNRPHISCKYIDFVKENTKARVVYYGHDLHFLREKRGYEITGDIEAKKASEKWKNKEIVLMQKADVVYYPSFIEVEEIESIDPFINVKAIKAYIFNSFPIKKFDFKRRKDILFVGGFGHPPNIDAVIWFAREVFPKVLEYDDTIHFIIVGSNPTEEVKSLQSSNIIVKGFVTDDELNAIYESSRIDIVPLRYGAGIKGKVIEGMRQGIPIVTTSVGAEGIENSEDVLIIKDTAEELAKEIVSLYNDEGLLENISMKEQKYVLENYSKEAAWSIISQDFS